LKYPSHWRYVCKVRQLLLGAGERGISFHDLNQLTRTKVFDQDDLREILNEWLLREWLQSFVVSTGARGRKPTIWRATTLLRDEWSSYNNNADPTEAVVLLEEEVQSNPKERSRLGAFRSKIVDPAEEDRWLSYLGLDDPPHRR
jgi:hypothetical protein